MSTFFTDRDLGNRFPLRLREAGIDAESHSAHFPDRARDEQWIRRVAAKRWFVLTHDERIRYRPNERDAVMTSGVGLFVLVGAAPAADLAENFVRMLPRVEAFIDRHPRPFIAKIYRPAPADLARDQAALGRVEMWLTKREWSATRRRARRSPRR
ncbi:MAG: hypothetical protein ACT4P7_22100 [Gemmatimonadaceae bacterium]